MRALELWAGPECTVNRVGQTYRDQLEETGFAHRLDDLDRLRELGIRHIRLPVLWERVAGAADGGHDWRWTDARIERLKRLGMSCIAGLLHHGSGPRHTDLLDPAFPARLAAYAKAVALRYPHLDAYTPVNEPLTTARFSALYGLWYPHRQDARSFVRALLHQVQATVLAMAAIREVNPAAELVATDDLGFTHAVPGLQYQADFDNERRWLAFDLLCGRVASRHPMWTYLRRHGASEAELGSLVEGPCLPGLIGINSYVTSERFLDDRLALYPAALHGGNARQAYVDVETVRVHGAHLGGMKARLQEAWQRYRLPVALTEVHLGCSREEQLRWLMGAWRAAAEARSHGADVRAVTAWAAFGTVDWASLVTRNEGRYEPGLWDVRGGSPRPTALAHLARQLAAGRAPTHPVLQGPGWWERGIRHRYPAHGAAEAIGMSGRTVLISGAGGTLGRAFARACHLRGLPYRLLSRSDLDIADRAAVEAALARYKPWAFINASGFVRVDDAEHQPRQWRDNVIGPATLAHACPRHGVRLVTYSSALVFDGEKEAAYVESDDARPLNCYGQAKAEAERRVAASAKDALIIRSAALFGPWDQRNFVTRGLQTLRRGTPWAVACDEVISPTYVRDLVTASLDLLIDGESGIWHLANRGSVSWHALATLAARAAGVPEAGIRPVDAASLGRKAARPRDATLASERGALMPTLEDALARYVNEIESDTLPEPEAPEHHFVETRWRA